MRFKVGDRVRIKSIDWYNKNKDEYSNVPLIGATDSSYDFTELMREFCGKVMTISCVYIYSYNMVEDNGKYFWTDEMIEGLVEEEAKPKYEDEVNGEYYSTPKYLVRPSGYQFKDENGNVINAMKIVLEKKKEYPKTFLECCDVLNIGNLIERGVKGYKAELFDTLQKLYICRDAYWKIAGEEMGLDKPWEPSDSDYITGRFCIFVHKGNIICDTPAQDCILTFPTEEMRDAFYENFKKEIEICKELL